MLQKGLEEFQVLYPIEFHVRGPSLMYKNLAMYTNMGNMYPNPLYLTVFGLKDFSHY